MPPYYLSISTVIFGNLRLSLSLKNAGSPDNRHLWYLNGKNSCDPTWHLNWAMRWCICIPVQSLRQCTPQLPHKGSHWKGLPRMRYRTCYCWVIAPQYLESIWSKCSEHDINARPHLLWAWYWTVYFPASRFERRETDIHLYANIGSGYFRNFLAGTHRELAHRGISGIGHLLKMMYHPRSRNFN